MKNDVEVMALTELQMPPDQDDKAQGLKEAVKRGIMQPLES